MAGRVLGGDGDDQVGDHLAGVADDRHVGRPVLRDLGRVDVGVHDGGLGREARQLAGDPVVEPGAERDDQVGLLQRGDRGDGAVHAGHAEVLRVAVGEGAARHQGGHDRDAGELGQGAQLGPGAGLDDAAADVQHRPAGRDHQPGRLADLLAVRLGDRPVARQVDRGRPLEGGQRLQRVLGDVHQHRAGPAGRGDVERLGDRARDVRRVGDQEVVLGDRHRDAADVRLLEGVGADRRAGHLPGDGHHRDAVHVRVGDRRDQVGGAGPAGRHADARPGRWPGRSRSAACPAPCSCRTRTCRIWRESISGSYSGQDRAPGDAEDGVDAGGLQRADETLRSGDLLGHRRDLFVSGDGGGWAEQKTPRPEWAHEGLRAAADGRQAARSATYDEGPCMVAHPHGRLPVRVNAVAQRRLDHRDDRPGRADGQSQTAPWRRSRRACVYFASTPPG